MLGVLVSLNNQELMAPIVLKKVSEHQSSNGTLLLHILFPNTCNFCENCSDRYARLFATQLLNACLQQIHLVLKEIVEVFYSLFYQPMLCSAHINKSFSQVFRNFFRGSVGICMEVLG